MQVRNALLLLAFLGLSLKCMLTNKSDTWPECDTFVRPMHVESGSEIGPALSVGYVPVVGFVSRP